MKTSFQDKPQYKNNTFVDDFLFPKLDLEWTFIRVLPKNTYSLEAKGGHSGYIQNRELLKIVKDLA